MTLPRFVIKAVLLATLVAATLGALLVIPAGGRTSFTEAIIDKQRRLESLPPGKLILVGGSNLAFGVDSRYLETTLRRPVVNMGLSGAVGIPFILDQVRPHISAGDLIVLSPEYELFFERPALTRPVCLHALYLPQPWRYVGRTGYLRCVVSTFGETVQHNFTWAVRKALRTNDSPPDPVYERRSFNRWGDVEGHLSRATKLTEAPRETGRIEGKPDEDVLDAITRFARFAKKRGARVAFVHPACAASAYAPHLDALRALDRVLRQRLGGDVIFLSVPEDFFFPPHMLFDTRYHLNRAGRALRSQRVTVALQSLVGIRANSVRIAPLMMRPLSRRDLATSRARSTADRARARRRRLRQ